MATKSEQFHAEEQQTGNDKATREGRSKPGIPEGDRSRDKTYALEETSGQPSRKSTRKSANRAKPDASLNLREALQKGSPEAKFRKAKAQGRRVQGSSAAG